MAGGEQAVTNHRQRGLFDPPPSARMMQWQEAKDRHPGMVLLFRVGDRYEVHQEDAELVLDCCGDCTVPSTGLVSFAEIDLEKNLRRLLVAGHRVAICEEVEDETDAHAPQEPAGPDQAGGP